MKKIALDEDRLFVIRSVRTKPNGKPIIMYYESPAVWNKSAVFATLFRDYDIGVAHLTMFNQRDQAKNGWADGSKEVLDVVPLYGCLVKT